MWELFVLSALVLQALESVIDKIAIIKDKTINSLGATFWRSSIFFLWFGILGETGILGKLKIFISLPIFLFALLWLGGSFFYTYQLKNIEISSISLFSSATPFFYLVIDALILHLNISLLHTIGIFLLVSGGLLFVLQPGKLKFRQEFNWKIMSVFLYNFILGVTEYYGFKYYFNHHLLNEVSFYFNTWLIIVLTFIFIITWQKKWGIIFNTINKNKFLEKTTISKYLDVMGSWLWLHAISIAAISQVNSLGALYPLILFMIIYFLQKILKLNVGEALSSKYLKVKIPAILLLCIGGLFLF